MPRVGVTSCRKNIQPSGQSSSCRTGYFSVQFYFQKFNVRIKIAICFIKFRHEKSFRVRERKHERSHLKDMEFEESNFFNNKWRDRTSEAQKFAEYLQRFDLHKFEWDKLKKFYPEAKALPLVKEVGWIKEVGFIEDYIEKYQAQTYLHEKQAILIESGYLIDLQHR